MTLHSSSSIKKTQDKKTQSGNSLLKNTLWLLLSQGSTLMLQAGYFVMIARALGPEQYGAFVGTTAFVSILAPFVSLGSGNLLVKNVSRNRTLFPEYWGNTLFMILSSGPVLILGVSLVASFFLPSSIPLVMIILAAIADLIFQRVILVSGQAFQSVLQLSKTALINILPQVTRILAALVLIQLVPHPSAVQWTLFYCLSTCVSALSALYIVNRFLGKPKLALWRIKPELKEGCYFAVGLSSKTVYNDLDKTMLARLASLEATGLYAAAYRLIDVSFVPVFSVLGASYAHFFQKGASGIQGSLRLAKKLTPLAALYGILAGVALYLGAPIVQFVFGESYAGTIEVIRWLSPLPCLKALHYFAADTLTGAGFQGFRSMTQIGIAVFNIVLNLWLIPLYSWKGAAWSSLASDGLLMLILWGTILFLYQRHIGQRHAAKPSIY